MAASLQSKTQQQQAAIAPTGASLYARFALAGAISCGTTHGSLTPVGTITLSLYSSFFHSSCSIEPSLYA